jgi:hypothetical protein
MLLRPEYLSQELDRPLPTKDGGNVLTVSRALELALFMDAKLDVSKL